MSSRNVPIDVARALSILVVVAFHLTMFGVSGSTLDSGVTGGTLPVSPGPFTWALSWVAMVMPLFFVVAGYANAHVLDRQRSEGGGYGAWLLERGGRLLGPLALYVGVWAVVATLFAWVGLLDIAQRGSQALTRVLWFLLIYLVLLCVAPLMDVAHERWGVLTLLVLGLAVLGLDVVRFVLGEQWAGNVNFVLVWVFVHQLGVAYHRGWWRTGARATAWATLGGSLVALLAVLLLVPYYPHGAVALWDGEVANLMPPTAAIAVLALAQTAALALLERRAGEALDRSARLQTVLRRMGALAMTIYLWHGPVIALAIALLYPFTQRHPSGDAVLVGRLALISVAVPLMWWLIPLVSILERRLVPPLTGAPRTGFAAASMALLIVGTWLVYDVGMLLHPAAPRATIGVLCLTAGTAMLRHAATNGPGLGTNRLKATSERP